MAQEVGDAVLRFIGDSSQLDSKFDEVTPNAEKAFIPAANVVEESTGRMKSSLYEAKGEARLLGEEFGVHLPRHVSSFIATLPGVGEALSAAFSATAILFIAQALVQVTEKATAFIANNLIYTQTMKDSNAATVEANKALLAQSAAYDKAKDSLDKFGASGTDSLRLQLEALKQHIATTKESVIEGEKSNQQQRQVTHEYFQQNGFLSKGYDFLKSIVTGGKTQLDTIKLQTAEIQNRVIVDAATVKALQEQQALLEKQLETEKKLTEIKQHKETQTSNLNAQRAQAEAAVSLDSFTADKRQAIKEHFEDMQYKLEVSSVNKQLAVLKENDENTKDAQARLYSELEVMANRHQAKMSERLQKSKDGLLKTRNEMGKDIQSGPPIEPITPMTIQNLLKGINTAHQLGITLRQDLVQAYKDAKKAQDDFMASGIQDGVAQTAIANNILKAKAALEAYGQTEDRFKIRSHGLWNEFRQDTKEGATAMDQVKQIGATAFDDLTKSLESAVAAALLSQTSFAQALEKATANALASIASQALVKALFYTAEGIASLAMFNYGSAGQYFAAAGEMAAVGAAAGITAHALSGKGGGGGNTQQLHNTESNTGTSNRSGGGSVVGVQGFATGALISAPTLAIMGEESKREAVLPLDDPQAMKTIGQAIGDNGGGVTHHWHINGMISADNLTHVVGRISKMVSKGQLNLTASNSLRLTKRSA